MGAKGLGVVPMGNILAHLGLIDTVFEVVGVVFFFVVAPFFVVVLAFVFLVVVDFFFVVD